MSFLIPYLPWIQIILSVILIALILLQSSEGSLGAAFGGQSMMGNPFRTKRGLEQKLFIATIIIAVLFVVSTILAFYFGSPTL